MSIPIFLLRSSALSGRCGFVSVEHRWSAIRYSHVVKLTCTW